MSTDTKALLLIGVVLLVLAIGCLWAAQTELRL